MKTALIFGVSGQDGAYLSRLLLEKNYAVHGTSRDAARATGVDDRVVMHSVATTNADAMRDVIDASRPDEIYNLSGLSSVALSFADPATAWLSIADAHKLLLDTVRNVAPRARVYHSASSECFGDTPFGSASNEHTPFAPRSPYAEAKVAAYESTREARQKHGLFACSGIVFNHESPLRAPTFVTKKIVAGAAAIAAGHSTDKLHLGDLSAWRDWGYAPETVEAMWQMLQQPEPDDFVIATGESHSVEDLAAAAFKEFDLDYREHVVIDRAFIRRAEIRYNRGDSARAREILGWEARTKFNALVRLLAAAAVQETPAAAGIASPQHRG